MTDDQVKEIAAEVVRRLIGRHDTDGGGEIVVVFTGATVELGEALRQTQRLLLDGFRLQVALSTAAEDLFGGRVRESLQDLPRVAFIQSHRWLGPLMEAHAVVVPLLSLNTASKLSLLIADTAAANIILHGLLMGKPVVMARNGADPLDKGRERLGFTKANRALQQAISARLRTLQEFGCVLVDVSDLSSTVGSLLAEQARTRTSEVPEAASRRVLRMAQQVICTSDVACARRMGADIRLRAGARVTPWAREQAARWGVLLLEE